MTVEALRWEGDEQGVLVLLEQTRLPLEVLELEVRTVAELVAAIRRLAVRGAPAIGVAAAYGIVLAVQRPAAATGAELVQGAREAARELGVARPTAVNLAWGLERMLAAAERAHARGVDPAGLRRALLAEAHAIQREDADACRRMGEHGAALLRPGMGVLTHCNAGALATAGIGTALAPIYVAHQAGLRLHVYAGETRPLLQGARLTAWELARAGVDVTLITDGAAASLMSAGRVQAVLVGADRIAANGDVCNKIGTYGLAVLAQRHGIPFYVVAPLSTFDPRTPDGAAIPIEQRDPAEVSGSSGARTAPDGVRVLNPAFDVTPAELVSAIVTELGVLARPGRASVADLLRSAGRL